MIMFLISSMCEALVRGVDEPHAYPRRTAVNLAAR